MTARRRLSRRHRHRLLAVLVGLAPFVVCEALLALLGLPSTRLATDPLAGFGSATPLFVRDGDRYVIDPPRLRYFAPAGFPIHKGADTCRIFVLGGSTVQGRPWSTPSSFPTWMQLALTELDPATDWQVVNCGGISYASYRLALVLDEILAEPSYAPDLIVLCTGHNEFLEDREYGAILDAPPLLLRPLAWLAGTRTARMLLEQLPAAAPAPRARLEGEVDTRLDHRGGLDAYRPDPEWRSAVLAHFESSVRRMARACRDRGLPLLLIDPPANLADCPPFKSAPWPDAADPRPAAELFAAAFHARAELRDPVGARRLFVAAKDADACPLRILEPQRALLRDLGVPLFDAHGLLEQHTADGILGDGQLADHVHPTIAANQRLGAALARRLAAGDLLPDHRVPSPPTDLDERIRTGFAAHLATLDALYFQRGRLTLEQLRRWSAGRVGSSFVQGR